MTVPVAALTALLLFVGSARAAAHERPSACAVTAPVEAHPSGCVVVLTVLSHSLADARQLAARFEVASVRESVPGTRSSRPSLVVTKGRVQIQSATLPWILSIAYRLEAERIVVPEGLADRRFDVAATMADGADRRSVPEMLQTLLRERFGLRAHAEQRVTSVYELTQRDGGHTMTKVVPADEVDGELSEAVLGAKILADRSGSKPDSETRRVMTDDGGTLVLSSTSRYDLKVTLRQTLTLIAARMSMNDLVGELRSRVDRPIIDGTGLDGFYRFETELPFDLKTAQVGQLISRANTDGVAADPIGTTVFRAVDVLGLKLEPRELPIPVLVVDAIERTPTLN